MDFAFGNKSYSGNLIFCIPWYKYWNYMLKRFIKGWWPYLVFALVYLILTLTGTRAEAFGFVQRGLLSTGLMKAEATEQSAETSTFLSNNANTLVLRDSDGKLHRLSEFKDRVLFINLWATWCPPCIAEMPSLEKLYQKTQNEVAFIMISRDRDFEVAKAFVERKGYSFPIYYAMGVLPEELSSSAIPTTFVIAPNGRLAYTHKGMANYDNPEIEKFLLNLKE
jgi:thiol-disulfide isomerase/thioredoxin